MSYTTNTSKTSQHYVDVMYNNLVEATKPKVKELETIVVSFSKQFIYEINFMRFGL